MNSWLQSMKQWTQWLMGESPLPDGRSKAMLAGTVASVAVVAVGVPALIPSTPSANAAAKQSATAGQDANSSQYTVPPTSSTVASSPVFASGSPTSTTPAASYVVPDPFAQAKKLKHLGLKHSAGATSGSGKPSTTGPVAAPLVAAPVPAGGAPTPVTSAARPAPALAPLVPIDPIPTLVAPATPPAAPFATSAQPFVGSALVTWEAPAGSTATGYDVFVGLAPGMEFPVPLNGANPVTGSSYLATGLTSGKTYYFTVRCRTGATSSSASNEVSAIPFDVYVPVGQLIGPVVSMASTADGSGYWLATASGAVSIHGSATDLGSPADLVLAAPIQKIVADPKANGYWEVAADGGVFAYGGAPFLGAASKLTLNSPIVDLVPTADGLGYWEVAADGGVFAFGDAGFYGSLGGTVQTAPTVGMAADGASGGYWLVSADGTVTAFNAPAIGPQAAPTTTGAQTSPTTTTSTSTTTTDPQPGSPAAGPPAAVRPTDTVVAIAATDDGTGVWEVTRSGAVFAYGDAPFLGPMSVLDPAAPVTSITADPSATGGYWLVSADGGVFAYGAGFYGAG
jgi:hypothetical protein